MVTYTRDDEQRAIRLRQAEMIWRAGQGITIDEDRAVARDRYLHLRRLVDASERGTQIVGGDGA